MLNKIKTLLFSLAEMVIRNIGGGLGQRVRYYYYKFRFKSCGTNVRIDPGTIFFYPETIEIGSNVWIGAYSVITGFDVNKEIKNRHIRIKKIPGYTDGISSLIIGNNCAFGLYNIIHGYGGLIIGSGVTTSARVSIYSFSHLPNNPDDPSLITYANSMISDLPIACISSPIIIEDGVWMGLGVTLYGGVIGKYSFISTNSVVTKNIRPNSFVRGNPAKRVKDRFKNFKI